MKFRWNHYLMLPILSLGIALTLAASAHAQNYPEPRSDGVSATLRVSFGTPLHWSGIANTRVEELPAAERPDYDMFRYGGTYYVYNNSHWYTSPQERGDFRMMDERSVPVELSRVPREHWRNYPSSWADANGNSRYQGPGGTSATLQVTLGTAPRWANVHGTRVEEMSQAGRPSYDMFRYGGSYYAYDNDRWYTSRQDQGAFMVIDNQSVPQELSRVPRDHWRNYPSQWVDSYGRSRDQGPGGTSTTLQISFGSTPRWGYVRGTRVREIRQGRHPDYDMFRYGNSYYVYSDNRWYVSRRWNGRFTYIDDRFVPSELSRVPRDRWNNYPQEWADQYGRSRQDYNRRRY